MLERSTSTRKITKFIGIDAGVHTGFAVWDSGSKAFLFLKTLSFFECLHQLLIFQQKAINENFNFIVVIENPKANSPTFEHFHKNAARVRDSISQRIGSNKRDAELIKEFCDIHHMTTIMVKPSKYSLTKLSSSLFKSLTGYSEKSSQHARDAAGLVFGMMPIIEPVFISKETKKKARAALFLPASSHAQESEQTLSDRL
jgi:hypothetical protein